MDSYMLKVKAAMQATAVAQNLPKCFLDDLGVDLIDIERFRMMDSVWLLRSSGTDLFPVGVGANPDIVLRWLDDSHNQTVKAYRINPRPKAQSVVTPISFFEAEWMATFPPFLPIKDVLRRGITLGIWGDTPQNVDNWQDWCQFFKAAGNHLMCDFIEWRIKTRRAMA